MLSLNDKPVLNIHFTTALNLIANKSLICSLEILSCTTTELNSTTFNIEIPRDHVSHLFYKIWKFVFVNILTVYSRFL